MHFVPILLMMIVSPIMSSDTNHLPDQAPLKFVHDTKNAKQVLHTTHESIQSKSLCSYLPEWIEKKQFSDKQNKLLHLVREETLSYLHSLPPESIVFADKLDNTLFYTRFCVASDWDPEETLLKLQNHLAWRKSNGLDEYIVSDDGHMTRFCQNLSPFRQSINGLRRFFPCVFHKTDKRGSPVYYMRIGKVDGNELFENISIETFRNFFIFQQESSIEYRLPAASLEKGELVTESLFVIDLEGLTLASFNKNTRLLLKQVAEIGQNHYPETMSSVYVVNAPFVFRVIWSFLYPLLPSRVRDYIFIYGDRFDYFPKLLEVIDRDSLPDFLGGVDTIFSEGETNKIEKGPWSQYLPKL
jgi:hypothetical protein